MTTRLFDASATNNRSEVSTASPRGAFSPLELLDAFMELKFCCPSTLRAGWPLEKSVPLLRNKSTRLWLISEAAMSPLLKTATPTGADMVVEDASVILMLKFDWPRTTLARGVDPAGWLNGFGKRTTRPLPVSATHTFPAASTATPEGVNRPCSEGTCGS